MEASKTHTLHLDGREKLAVTGLEEVVSSNASGLVLKTCAGTITVTGAGINITRLSLDEGVAVAEGSFDSFKYSDSSKARGLAGKLFK